MHTFRRSITLWFLVFLVLSSFVSRSGHAEAPVEATTSPQPEASPSVEPASPPQLLPDLLVTTIETDADCELFVTIGNKGPGGLPESAYDVPGTVVIVTDGTAAALSLKDFDAYKMMTRTGKTVTRRFSEALAGDHQVEVRLDPEAKLLERRADNNVRSHNFRCKPVPRTEQQIPDITISSVTFDEDCQAKLSIQNLGDQGIQDEIYRSNSEARLERHEDGKLVQSTLLAQFDAERDLQNVGGGVVWLDAKSVHSERVKYRFEPGALLKEKSLDNNERVVPIPARCRTPDFAKPAP